MCEYIILLGLVFFPYLPFPAIIGGGVGGASSAYFLRALAPPEANFEIHLFNQGNIGGNLICVAFLVGQIKFKTQKVIL